ncbi:MAG: hypothetical protein E7391_05020 [Ruminococcaceae bacterium]|nr:hypothetical protein [Oscillospiraceae bacterium]
MKKLISLVLCLIMIVSCFSCVSFAESEIQIVVDGSYLTMDQSPIIVEGRTLVPLRAIFEALGATVTWDDTTKTATGVLGTTTVSLQIDNTQAKVNGKDVTLDVPAQIVNSRTLVPVRFISESLGLKVDWDDATKTVIITTPLKLIKEWNFEDKTILKENEDFIAGGGISAKNIAISTEQNATDNGSKSLKMAERTSSNHRVKLMNAFSEDMIGKTYTITAKAYLSDASGSVRMGLYSTTNTEYATKPIAEVSVKAEKGKWVDLKLTYKHENTIITQIGFDQYQSARSDNIFIDDVKIFLGTDEVFKPTKYGDLTLIKEWTFNDTETFKNNTDFITGGGYNADGVSVSADFDANGNGKSLKLDKRTNLAHRIKFKNVFTKENIGKVYTVKAKVYVPDYDMISVVGAYSDVNTIYAMSPISYTSTPIKKNTWTEVEYSFLHEKEMITQLGFGQADGKTVPLFYIDDVQVFEGGVVKEEVLEDLTVTDGHRPVPTEFSNGKGYDDLIYFGEGKKTADELLKALPEGKEVVGGNYIAEYLQKNLEKQDRYNPEHGKLEVIDVSGMPFTKAVRATVYNPLDPAYAFQLGLGTPLEGKAEEGDVCLLRLWMRTEKGGQGEAQMGNVMVVIEENGGGYAKTITANVTNASEWKEFYFPFKFKDNYTHATIRLAYYTQVVDIGGYTITNYGKDVDIDSLPTDTNSSPYLARDAAWRKEAWERIENIRKDNFSIVVKDKNGNLVNDADIKVNMYEHEFEWGVAIHSSILKDDFYRKELQKNFNAAVCENHCKWNIYDQDPSLTEDILKEAKNIGIKYIRGHLLAPPAPFVYTEGNTTTPKDLPEIYNDKDALLKRIKDHVDEITTHLKEYIPYEWDVVNEAARRHDIRDEYGLEIIKQTYDIARQAMGETGRLYYNDFTLDQTFYDMMDGFVEAGIDIDGIGLQSHYGSPLNPESIYNIYEKMAAYGKRLKVTEYDFSTTDFELQANFTRDFMITTFSHPSMDGLIMWGFRGGASNQYVLFDRNNNPKPALTVWQDLIYNKWWTDKEGKTDSNGTFNVDAYFGDYDITVTKDGKTYKTTAKLYKNSDRTLEVVID